MKPTLKVGDVSVPLENVLSVKVTFLQCCKLLIGMRLAFHVKRPLKRGGVRHFVVELR